MAKINSMSTEERAEFYSILREHGEDFETGVQKLSEPMKLSVLFEGWHACLEQYREQEKLAENDDDLFQQYLDETR